MHSPDSTRRESSAVTVSSRILLRLPGGSSLKEAEASRWVSADQRRSRRIAAHSGTGMAKELRASSLTALSIALH